jgi:hypothetical protein
MNPKPQLIPVAAPWKVESAISALRLVVQECENPIEVEFNATGRFNIPGLGGLNDPPAVAGDELQPAAENDTDLFSGFSDGRVRVTFESTVLGRLCRGYADGDPLNEDAYDWSQVPFSPSLDTNVHEWRKAFYGAWRKSGLCPDPLMHEVHGSAWLQEVVPNRSQYRHFLIEGHEAYVEVIAERWRWELIWHQSMPPVP